MKRQRIRNAIRRWAYRRRFANVLRANGYVPTRQMVDLAMDYEADGNPRVVIRESWKP